MGTTPFHLEGKTILVTGASSGIGRQTCISASRMGARLILSGRNEKNLRETFSQCEGKDHLMIVADLLKEEDREKLAQELPLLDGLVHCAGYVEPFPTRFINQEKIDRTYGINYDAPVLLMAAIQRTKKLNSNASLVFLSSVSADHPHRGGALYGSSKAALATYVKVLALELATRGIRANCISPAMVKSPMYDKAENDASKEMMEEHIRKYPLGAGETEDVAHAAIYLLSSASRWVTGINLILDGGLLLAH